jgi:hypothetical protein
MTERRMTMADDFNAKPVTDEQVAEDKQRLLNMSDLHPNEVRTLDYIARIEADQEKIKKLESFLDAIPDQLKEIREGIAGLGSQNQLKEIREKVEKLEHLHLPPDGNWILVVQGGKVVFKQAAPHNLWAGDTVNLSFEFVPV